MNFKDDSIVELLIEECSEFFLMSNGFPLLKELPNYYNDFQKVKARKKKNSDEFVETFNNAFQQETHDLRQRAIFAHGYNGFEPEDLENMDIFYIFPINGFKFLYSPEVENSNTDYKDLFDCIFDSFGSNKGHNLVSDVLKFTYHDEQLDEGIKKGSEIIIYDIPHFYVLRSTVCEYEDLANEIFYRIL